MRPRPDNATLERMLGQSCRAPSLHNTQPWRWVGTVSGVQLLADHRRRLVYADSTGRDLVMSCGAALHSLVVAAAAEGWAARVDRAPDPDRPEVLADVRFSRRSAGAEDVALAGALEQRRTDRRRFSSWPVPESRLAQLAARAASRGVLATALTGAAQVDVVLELLAASARYQHLNDAYLDELQAWSGTRHDEGVPQANLVDRLAGAALGQGGSRFPAGGLSDAHEEQEPPGDAWLLLSTSSDDTLSWLRAGEALQAVWLRCVLDGLALVPHTQPVEVEVTRRALMDRCLAGSSCPQVLLRVGWPPVSREPVAATPRRPLTEVYTPLPATLPGQR